MSFRFSIVEAYTASWIEIFEVEEFPDSDTVEAYTASWIEMPNCTSSCGVTSVEAYTASWIEIYEKKRNEPDSMSGLIQPRGLK